jgi:hypothetical protein
MIKKECSVGTYDVTISFIDLVSILSSNHPFPMDNVYEMIPFICANIFAVHDSWRYYRLEHKSLISLKCLQIFTKIISDSFINDPNSGYGKTYLQ